MNERDQYPQEAMAIQGQLVGKRRPDLTPRQNIDQQIEAAEKRVVELKEIRARLDETRLLDSRIDDLQQAMRW